jgi:hypothetical protein
MNRTSLHADVDKIDAYLSGIITGAGAAVLGADDVAAIAAQIKKRLRLAESISAMKEPVQDLVGQGLTLAYEENRQLERVMTNGGKVRSQGFVR